MIKAKFHLLTPGNLLKSIIVAFTMVAFVACFGNVNTSNSKFFTEDGISTEKIKSFASSQPSNVKFYVEVSGSMNGFFRSNLSTKFKNDVWSVITDLVSNVGLLSLYR